LALFEYPQRNQSGQTLGQYIGGDTQSLLEFAKAAMAVKGIGDDVGNPAVAEDFDRAFDHGVGAAVDLDRRAALGAGLGGRFHSGPWTGFANRIAGEDFHAAVVAAAFGNEVVPAA